MDRTSLAFQAYAPSTQPWGNSTSCTLSQLACDFFYSGSKFIIYVWLIEKVWIVSGNSIERWRSPTYIFHMCLLLPYVAIFTLMVYFKIASLDETGACLIGLQIIASVPLLIYDFILSTFMGFLFIKPLFIAGKNAHDDWRNSRLHGVAVRSFVATLVGLLVSFANILALVLFPYGVRDVICFTSCTIDVTINVITIHWVTAYSGKPPTPKKPDEAPVCNGPGDTHGTTLTSELIRTQNSTTLHGLSELGVTSHGDEEYALSHIPVGIVADSNEQQLRASYIPKKSTLPRNQMDNASFDSYNYSTHETINSFTSLKDHSTVTKLHQTQVEQTTFDIEIT
ncbi:hypothetical protein PHYBLDRAFT_181506 [Phycomyces blakesleeanus NRRL 1555(-)]|uniref:Uncharacterized protein n=1 Tax=Phycomyces blakesleeanus (strain ATCC 8743b / DSM 1359 / FGSC 10004 / NBRC 33097 / NRRL 1555) TaxID=763407 RepID=A0A162PJ53_PHYB8|nr:hypothetical protein PHYBLDRAFT_181506 [Phycomyces blakesleeanus NRRL 1555(-)]OAD73357.1 hypothetical protein PHYBLDRAFT_181506 [Phycomyces blakesleeanus NRRL 1555(-)]|eukprot:XP_018291397.1 hypothetical protein PHYBLDRAFT_181506 [Phycomyces blakesleeanus NRRL 1555(-)]